MLFILFEADFNHGEFFSHRSGQFCASVVFEQDQLLAELSGFIFYGNYTWASFGKLWDLLFLGIFIRLFICVRFIFRVIFIIHRLTVFHFRYRAHAPDHKRNEDGWKTDLEFNL
jgi:hypothetical protein